METIEITSSPKSPRFHVAPRLIILVAIFFVVALAVLFSIQVITKTGIFHQNGQIIFDDSVTEEERSLVNDSLAEVELHADLNVSAISNLEDTSSDNSILIDIRVAVTDFYDTSSTISSNEISSAQLIPIQDLENTQKLLAIDGNYYLDTFTSGAVFRYLTISSDNNEDLITAFNRIASRTPNFPDAENVLSLAQTGVTALSRGMKTKLDQTGDTTFFTKNIGDFLSSFDLTHTSNEASFSKNATSDNICADPKMIDVLTNIGLDIVELTGNHNQDCGDQDAINTIKQYRDLGIQIFGGGENAEQASKALEISEKNNSITMLGYNYSTGGYTTDNTPGANYYTDEKATADIASAKERGDFIIVDVQFFECNNYVDTNESTICDYADSSEGDQISFFRHLIDLGADIVIGTAAHQPQTFELYNSGAIYYGLGNLFFDQSWWPGTTRSLVLIHYFYENRLLQTRIIPTVFDNSYQTKLMENEDAAKFLQRLINVRPTQKN